MQNKEDPLPSHSTKKKVTVTKNFKRLDHCLKEIFPDFSRSRLEALITEGHVHLNGAIVTVKSRAVSPGDSIETDFPAPGKPVAVTRRLNRLYEDDDMVIINKQPGIAVHPGAGARQETIMDIFLQHCPAAAAIPDTDRPGIVHRLDRDTSGTLILAKNLITMKRLQKMFKRHQVRKSYLALVQGNVRFRSGTVDKPLVRSNRDRRKFIVSQDDSLPGSREAVTDYRVLIQFPDFALVLLQPATGRTHQLRVHMAHLGNPILGDPWYSKNRSMASLALHAWKITFPHPEHGHIITAHSPVPENFLVHLRRHFGGSSAVSKHN